MRRLLLLAMTIQICAGWGLAQDTGGYNKFEFYAGYSLARIESNVSRAAFTSTSGTETFTNLCSSATGNMIGQNAQKFFCERRNANGFDTSITFNVNKYVGLKGDVTGHFKTTSFTDVFNPPGVKQNLNNEESLYNFLAGVQIKNNRTARRVKPFGHALVGFARYMNDQSQILDLFPQFNFAIRDRDTSFAMKLGGGVDVRVGKRIDVRLFELDYNPVFSGDRNPRSISGPFTTVAFTGRTMHNFTFGAGIVIH